MTNEENNQQTIPVKNGLVAFFDVLGFKKMLSANETQESLNIINKCLLNALIEAEKSPGVAKLKIQTFVISDSILIVLPDLTEMGAFVFAVFCDRLFFELLTNGLPSRGAIASGKCYIQSKKNQIVFAGQPIVDAHELANSLEIAACALTPASEKKVLNDKTQKLFEIYKTPIKELPPCKLYLLKFGAKFSCDQIAQYFDEHNKHLDMKSRDKLNNTIKFLKNCGNLK